jgi:hypothetical protein
MIVIDSGVAGLFIGLMMLSWGISLWLWWLNRELDDDKAVLRGHVIYYRERANRLEGRPSAKLFALPGGKRLPDLCIVEVPVLGKVNLDRPGAEL